MKALLFSGEGQEAVHGNTEQYNRSTGTHRIAQIMRDLGFEVNVIDFLHHWSEEQLLNFIRKQDAENIKIVGLNTTFLNDSYSKNFLFLAKQIFPNAKIIAGGQDPYIDDLYADYYISGFAEKAIVAVVDHILYNKKLKAKKHFNGLLVDAVWGEYSAFPMKNYSTSYHPSDLITPADITTIELSRGCKFSCKYCSYPYIGNKVANLRNVKDIQSELIENYDRWGLNHYIIADDTLNESTEKLEILVEAVDGLSFKPTFASFVRLDLMRRHPEHIKLMAKARVLYHYYGVETFNHLTGKIIGKGLHPDFNKQMLLDTYDYFMNEVGDYGSSIGMIVGLPNESVYSIKESYDWLKEEWHSRKQNVQWWPLIIPKNSLKLSAFGVDLEKYNYKKLYNNDDDRVKEILEDPYYRVDVYHKSSEPTVLWKNQHMNFYQAANLAKEYTKIYTNIPGNYVSLNMLADGYPKENFDLVKYSDYVKQKAEKYIEEKCSQ